MVIGATVLAALILLLLLAERGSNFLWQGGQTASTLYYCRPCDLRYPVDELLDRRTGVCPRGHTVEEEPAGIPFSTIFICATVVFIVCALVLIGTGRAR